MNHRVTRGVKAHARISTSSTTNGENNRPTQIDINKIAGGPFTAVITIETATDDVAIGSGRRIRRSRMPSNAQIDLAAFHEITRRRAVPADFDLAHSGFESMDRE